MNNLEVILKSNILSEDEDVKVWLNIVNAEINKPENLTKIDDKLDAHVRSMGDVLLYGMSVIDKEDKK